MPAYDLRRGYGDRHVLLFVSDAAACNYAKGVTPQGVSVEVWERTRLVASLTGQSERLCEGAWYLAAPSSLRLELAAFTDWGKVRS
jgi:hypothetical protein